MAKENEESSKMLEGKSFVGVFTTSNNMAQLSCPP
jgi:hypothetical protein